MINIHYDEYWLVIVISDCPQRLDKWLLTRYYACLWPTMVTLFMFVDHVCCGQAFLYDVIHQPAAEPRIHLAQCHYNLYGTVGWPAPYRQPWWGWHRQHWICPWLVRKVPVDGWVWLLSQGPTAIRVIRLGDWSYSPMTHGKKVGQLAACHAFCQRFDPLIGIFWDSKCLFRDHNRDSLRSWKSKSY